MTYAKSKALTEKQGSSRDNVQGSALAGSYTKLQGSALAGSYTKLQGSAEGRFLPSKKDRKEISAIQLEASCLSGLPDILFQSYE